MSTPDEHSPAPARPRSRWLQIVGAAGIALAAGLGVTARYGVLTDTGRRFVEAGVEGQRIGQFGNVHVEGLQGDLWRDFRLRRLALRDSQGIWWEARDLHMTWRASALLHRRFEADLLTARKLTILRRPILSPKRPDKPAPVSIHLLAVQTQVETLPAFSAVRGLYDARARFDIARIGRQSGQIHGASRLHAGDRLDIDFLIGDAQPMRLDIRADEANGGAMAGALGLAADRRFRLRILAGGQLKSGHFEAVATSGDTRPLEASGAWTPAGGAARGRWLLSASRLTAGLAERVGPEAHFEVNGRKARSMYELTGRLTAANLTATASGLGDIGKRRSGPNGLRVMLATADISKVSGAPATGPAQLVGVWKGDADTWAFKGQGEAQKGTLGGYALARISGPVSVAYKGRDYSYSADLTGAGGAGQGFVAALLGAAPKAQVEGSQLADGRVLLRRVDVTGKGLVVRASGDRGLLGGLSFKGQAEISNLAAARPDASGLVRASWSASQGGAEQPWSFTVDAKATRFASGMAELDRLLGAQPTLVGAAILDRGVVANARSELTGAMGRVETTGDVGPAGRLALKLAWSAKGPFRAGSVEISGQARGSGSVTGDVMAPKADLIADFDAIDAPRLPLKDAHVTLTFVNRADGTDGVASLTAQSAYGPARASSAFRFTPGGVDLTDLSVDGAGVQASGALSLRRRAPSAADLHLAIGRGALLDQGLVAGTVRIVDAAGGARADVSLTAKDALMTGAGLAIRSGRISAEGPLARLPYRAQLEGEARGGAWSLDGGGLLTDAAPDYTLSFQGSGQARGRSLSTVEPAIIHINGENRDARVRLAAPDGGRIDLTARLADGAADIRGQIGRLSLETLDQDLAGKIDANFSVQGHGGPLSGELDARVENARGRGTDVKTGLDGTLKAKLSGDTVSLNAQATNAMGLQANANLVLPAESSARPFRIAINRVRPMSGRFFAEGEVKPLWDLLVGGDRSLSGQIRAQGSLSGTLADPLAQGEASLGGARFQDGATGLILTDAKATATFLNGSVDVREASGSDGRGGMMSGAGRVSLARNGVSSLRMDLKAFRLIDNEQATAAASGQVTIDRAADGKVRISGALGIDRAEVAAETRTPSGVVAMEVVERNKPADLKSALAPAPRANGAVALDVTLKAPRRVFIRGRGLDMEMSLDARVAGTTSRPRLSGVARVVRGDYEFAGKRFTFDDRGVVYLSTRLEDIRLDLSAKREDPALTAVVQIRGTAADPEITLTSTPVLPNDEVLSQVLFGRSASQLSPLEAAQLASALSALAGGGGFDVMGNLKAFARLDRLALGGGDQSGVTVSGGKYLTEDVYLEITGGGREGASAEVQWRVGRRLSILSRLGSQNNARLAVRWRRDY